VRIEIVDRRQQSPRRGYRFGSATLLLLVALLVLGMVGNTVFHVRCPCSQGCRGKLVEGRRCDLVNPIEVIPVKRARFHRLQLTR
jgi:hypothetical protein